MRAIWARAQAQKRWRRIASSAAACAFTVVIDGRIVQARGPGWQATDTALAASRLRRYDEASHSRDASGWEMDELAELGITTRPAGVQTKAAKLIQLPYKGPLSQCDCSTAQPVITNCRWRRVQVDMRRLEGLEKDQHGCGQAMLFWTRPELCACLFWLPRNGDASTCSSFARSGA